MNTVLLVTSSFVLYLLWIVWLYPKFFSPIKALPELEEEADVSKKTGILREPTGEQLDSRLQQTSSRGVGIFRSKAVFGGDRVIITSDEALGEVLRKPDLYQIPRQRRLLVGHLFGEGLPVVEGAAHKYQRKHLGPAFSHANIRHHYTLFWQKASELVTQLSKETKNKEGNFTVDFYAWAGRVTMDVIGIAAFGTDLGLLMNDQTEFSTKYMKAFGWNPINGLRLKLAYLLPGWLFKLLPLKKKSLLEASSFIRARCAVCVRQARQAMQREKQAGPYAHSVCRVAMDSNAFSDKDMEDQLMTMLGAGHDTIQSALTLTVALLCEHEKAQTRLRNDITLIKSTAEEIEWDETIARIVQIPYLQAFCHESLRLFPPLPVLRRQPSHSTTLLGYKIPKGTMLLASPWVVNRDTSHWGPDASQFRPERWLETTSAGESPKFNARGGSTGKHSFMTFFHGPRNCIGQVFATTELLITVAALVSSFQMTLGAKKSTWAQEIVVKPKEGLEVILKPIAAS